MLSVTDAVTEAEVARAKAQLKASLVMNLESASSRADQIARQFLAFGEVPAIGTLIGKIDAVSQDQVRDLARQLFKSQTPAFSAVGHIDTLSDYTTLVKSICVRLSWPSSSHPSRQTFPRCCRAGAPACAARAWATTRPGRTCAA